MEERHRPADTGDDGPRAHGHPPHRPDGEVGDPVGAVNGLNECNGFLWEVNNLERQRHRVGCENWQKAMDTRAFVNFQ